MNDNMLHPKRFIGLMLALALVVGACGDDDGATTVAPSSTTAAVVEFDLTEAIAAYASTIPDGYMNVGDVIAFKDAIGAGALVIDVREPGEYAEGHIEGAINIPLRTLTDNLNLIPTDRQVFVHCMTGHRAGMAVSSLRMLGYDNVLGFTPGFDAWIAAGEEASLQAVTGSTFEVPAIAPDLFAAVDGFVSAIPEGWLAAGDVDAVKDAVDAGAYLLDVRSGTEYAEGFIPSATNIGLRTLVDGMSQIPTDQPVIVYCRTGWRAALSVPVLHLLGFENVKAFNGSYTGWTAAGEPVATP